MDRQRLVEAALQATIVGLIVGGVVIAGFDRVDASGRARWAESSRNRAMGIAISEANGARIEALRVDVDRMCGARR